MGTVDPGPAPVRFRPLTRADLPLVRSWLVEPHVARWWTDPSDPDALEARYGPAIDGTDPTEVLVALDDDGPVGLVQRYLLRDEPAWSAALAPARVPGRAFGIDYLVGDPARTGHGLGPVVIDALVVDSFARHPGCDACVVAVATGNRRSWRALERAGFHRTWAGPLDTDDPGDAGPHVVYVRRRHDARPGGTAA